MLGQYISLWQAQSLRENLTTRGGGGIVTTLLVYALEKGIITEALVVRSSNKEPWAEAVIARTLDEVTGAAGPKYVFVPYGDMIEKLAHKSGVVGLPCQIRAYRKRDFLKLGLFGGLNLSPRGLDYLLAQLRIDKEDIAALDYRAPGGGLLVKLRGGEEIAYGGYSWLAYFFSYEKCIRCTDNTNHAADISVGDRPWQRSSVVVRTERGKELFLSAVSDGYVSANPLTKDEFVAGVQSPFFQKELRGGYINTKLVRVRGKWVEYVPLPVLRLVGLLLYRWTNRVR